VEHTGYTTSIGAKASRRNGSPLLKAAGLWRKKSASGNEYFVGRLGGVRIVILQNRDAARDSEPDFHLFFAERREDAPQPRAPSRRRSYGVPRAEAALPLPDDRVDDLWPTS
jgi:hypothetical protein